MPKARERLRSTDGRDIPRAMVDGLPLEARVILLSAGGDAASPLLRKLLAQNIDWPLLCALADREQASPILWAQVRRLGCGGGPESDPLKRLAMVSEFSLLRLQRRLYETCDALAAGGIDAVLLKGAAVAHTAYPRFVERPMRDIDLLVEPEQADAAKQALQAAGWVRRSNSFADDAYDGHQHLPPYTDAKGSDATVELHTDLFFEGHPFRFSPKAVRARARRLCVDQHVLLVPDPLHQLFHACLHFAYGHLMSVSAWRTFRDVAALAGSGSIDWKEFVVLARESGGATSCYWTFRLAQAAAGVTVPSDVLDGLRPPLPDTALRILERHFSRGLMPTCVSCPSVRLRNLMWRAGVFPGGWNRGSVRPWGRLRRFRGATEPGPRGLLQRLPRHIRHAAAAPGYLWSVVCAPTSLDVPGSGRKSTPSGGEAGQRDSGTAGRRDSG
ncbi:MAG: nucleotidyltransferase family protein [Gemmatimonadales bacterium]|nr:nucleotidyltransferase family protein [Gemmatimonadales bacterium]